MPVGGKYYGDGDGNVVNATSSYCSLLFQLDNDRSIRDAVLAELKPLLLRVRCPTSRLYEDFLTSLTAYRVEDYDTAGGRGRINTTATAYRETVRWLRRRATDVRDTVLRHIKEERREAMRHG